MSLSDNLRRLPRERVPTIAVGRDLDGFLILTRMGSPRNRNDELIVWICERCRLSIHPAIYTRIASAFSGAS